MATIVTSQSLAAMATFTSTSTAWVNNDVIICSCQIGSTAPNQQCQVTLQGSIDNVNFVNLLTLTFGNKPNQSYYRSFRCSDFFGAGDYTAPSALERLNSVAAPPAIWSNFKLAFFGNDTQAVTIAAVH